MFKGPKLPEHKNKIKKLKKKLKYKIDPLSFSSIPLNLFRSSSNFAFANFSILSLYLFN